VFSKQRIDKCTFSSLREDEYSLLLSRKNDTTYICESNYANSEGFVVFFFCVLGKMGRTELAPFASWAGAFSFDLIDGSAVGKNADEARKGNVGCCIRR